MRRSSNVAPSCVRATIGGSHDRRSGELIAGDADADRGDRRARRRTGAGDCLCWLDLADARGRDDLAGALLQIVDCRGDHRPERDVGCCGPVEIRQRRSLHCCHAHARPGATPAPRDAAQHFATRSARPAMTPACGPPNSLSPLNVTSAAPSSSVWRAAGSPCSHAGGGPASHGQFASIRPLPMSATTGTPSVARSATVVASTNPSTR